MANPSFQRTPSAPLKSNVEQHGRRMIRMMSITNRTELPRPVYVEPEGADYWMLPEQTFELRAEDVVDPSAQFEIWDNGDCLQVWPSNGMGFISVFAEEQELECGHQRPQAA